MAYKRAILLSIGIGIGILLANALISHPEWFKTGAIVVGLIAGGVALYYFVRWHSGQYGYRCPMCTFQFRISPWADFSSPGNPNKKRLTCPSCGQRSWCEEIEGRKVPQA